MKKLLVVITALLFHGCTTTSELYLPTVKSVDVNKYMGKWYEIAKYENRFEIDCEQASANYSLNDDGTIKVVNSCFRAGKIDNAIGKAYSTNPENTKLKVSFFWPFKGNYWVIMLDKEYSYAVVSEPSRKYLWILSRTKTMPKETTKEILLKLKELGFDTDKLIFVKQ
jgi:apolipoprotein D and lipocalin family protein